MQADEIFPSGDGTFHNLASPERGGSGAGDRPGRNGFPGDLDSGGWASHPAKVGEVQQESSFLLVATGDAWEGRKVCCFHQSIWRVKHQPELFGNAC